MAFRSFEIAGREIGFQHPCFIIAEAGVNHNGHLDMARRMVRVAAEAGADAIKFQTFNAEKLATTQAPKAKYQTISTGAKETQFEMLRKLELSIDEFRILHNDCLENKILFLSTPFDEDCADLLESIDMSAFKIASGEITNLPLLSHIARKGRPMILSTGMSYLNEVDMAVRTVQSSGNDQIALLHCTSNYPALPADVNLRAMNTLAQAFQVVVGFSDHTTGIEIPLAAVARSARIIEKHFTLDRSLAGPDHKASLEPAELEAMVKGIRKVESSLGTGRKEPVEHEFDTAMAARKSIVARTTIPAGTVLNEAHFAMMRPGTGLPPVILQYLIGRVARVEIAVGALISFGMIE